MLRGVQDLERLRKDARRSLATRDGSGVRLVIAMGTCGIAAGARDVVTALIEALDAQNLSEVTLTQCGCKGLCDREPTVDVLKPGEPPVTYGDVNPDAARRILAEHVVGGKIVDELVLFVGESDGPHA